MRHQRRIPQLSRPADQRKALLRGLTTQLIREGRVTTTKARAKALRDETERMITLAKDGSLSSRRRAIGYVYDKQLVHALFEKAQERYGERKEGIRGSLELLQGVVIIQKWQLLSLYRISNFKNPKSIFLPFSSI